MKQARVGRGARPFRVRLPQGEDEALRRLAKRRGGSINLEFIEAVRAYLAAQGEGTEEGGGAVEAGVSHARDIATTR